MFDLKDAHQSVSAGVCGVCVCVSVCVGRGSGGAINGCGGIHPYGPAIGKGHLYCCVCVWKRAFGVCVSE